MITISTRTSTNNYIKEQDYFNFLFFTVGLKIINICPPFLLVCVPPQNPFVIGCKRLSPTIEIRWTVGERLQTFATVSLY